MKQFLNIVFSLALVSSLAFSQLNTDQTGAVPNLKLDRSHTIVNTPNNPATIAYGHSGIQNYTLSIPIPAGTPFTQLSPWTAPSFASTMIKGGDGTYYLVEVSTGLYTFNTETGTVTLLGNISGLEGADQVNGIAFNPANGNYYLAAGSLSPISDNIYSFNINTRVATLIGSTGTGGVQIDLGITTAGVCYSYDLVNNNAYIINLSTGEATLLGALGFDPNYGQGMSIDNESGVVYLSAFNGATNTGQLRTLNTSDGSTTLIVDWGFDQIAPFAINIQYGPDNVVLVSPANNSTEVSTNTTLTWQNASGASTYDLQVSLSLDFSNSTIDKGNITGTSFTLSGIAENTKYYWRVRGKSGTITGGWSEVWGFTTVATIQLNHTVVFPSKDKAQDYQSSDYKIVGVPGSSDMDVKIILSGTQGTDWQVYWDNGNATDYYVKYNGTDVFLFWTGRSFWIIRKGNLNISRTVAAKGIGPEGIASIGPLNSGFNLITNPFTVSVDWADVQAANGGSLNSIKTYNNGWTISSKLEPYVGYLFDNPGLTYLHIPHPSVPKAPLKKQADLTIWRVEIELTCGEFFDKTTSFGISGEASEGRDKFDFRKPRGMGNTPFVYFYHPEWDNGYGIFETDIRPQFEEQQTWDLKVYSELRESEKLKFSGIEKIPGDMEVYLLDVDRAKYINLRHQEEYEFTAVKTISEFQILVGKPELINSKLNGLLPTEFELGNNFPNPFNPITTIPLSIPQTADIKLIVYNILGQEVRVLYDGTLEPGKYWYQWDGKDNMGQAVPSGIYLYNFVSSTGINFSKKMVLIK